MQLGQFVKINKNMYDTFTIIHYYFKTPHMTWITTHNACFFHKIIWLFKVIFTRDKIISWWDTVQRQDKFKWFTEFIDKCYCYWAFTNDNCRSVLLLKLDPISGWRYHICHLVNLTANLIILEDNALQLTAMNADILTLFLTQVTFGWLQSQYPEYSRDIIRLIKI